MGALSNSGRKAANYAGFYKGMHNSTKPRPIYFISVSK